MNWWHALLALLALYFGIVDVLAFCSPRLSSHRRAINLILGLAWLALSYPYARELFLVLVKP